MTQRLNIHLRSAAAMLLLVSSLSWSANTARAEITLQAATGMQFSLPFRLSGGAATTPILSVQPPDIEEVSTSSLYTVENSLQLQQASLAQLSAGPGSLRIPLGEGIAQYIDQDTQALPLGSAAWNFPKACIELVSGERPASQQLANRAPTLTADYAATAFGGTCTVWDLTSEDSTVAVQPAIAIPFPSIVARLDAPLRPSVPLMQQANQLAAAAQHSPPSQPDLSLPTRAGDGVRPWVMAPNVAAKFRGNGFQLISADHVTEAPAPAVRRPAVRTGAAGFRLP